MNETCRDRNDKSANVAVEKSRAHCIILKGEIGDTDLGIWQCLTLQSDLTLHSDPISLSRSRDHNDESANVARSLSLCLSFSLSLTHAHTHTHTRTHEHTQECLKRSSKHQCR